MASKDMTNLLKEVGDRQSSRQERLLKHLESNRDILMPLLEDLRETEGEQGSQKLSKTSEPAWIDLLREDNPGLAEETLRQIARET